MGEVVSNLILQIAEINFNCCFFYPLVPSKKESINNYINTNPGVEPDYTLFYKIISSVDTGGYVLMFKGEPEENEFLNYNWRVFRKGEDILIVVDFLDATGIKSIAAKLKKDSNSVSIDIVPRNTILKAELAVDPFIHPLGSLLLFYLMQQKQGLLIHASGVKYNDECYLFTGVSGIGKSTMANLWEKKGAAVLNDDRLVIRLQDEVKVYNNPMPYQQVPQGGVLNKIFLLKQSSTNYIVPVKGVVAYSRLLGNFIQQFYDKDIVKRHLELIEKLVQSVPVYEVGFTPDTEIVDQILQMKSGE